MYVNANKKFKKEVRCQHEGFLKIMTNKNRTLRGVREVSEGVRTEDNITSRELLALIRENSIKIEILNGKLSATPLEKAQPLVRLFITFKPLLLIRAKGEFRDWDGRIRRVKDECGSEKCFCCEEWVPYMPDNKKSGLCASRIKKEALLIGGRLKGVDKAKTISG